MFGSSSVNVGMKAIDRLTNIAVQIEITAHETRLERGIRAKQVLQHQHLSIGIRAGADADNRDIHRGCHLLADRGRNAFQDHRETARFGETPGRADKRLDRGVVASLDAHSAKRVYRLRRQAEVAHDRNARLDDVGNQFRHALFALDLDRVRACLHQ